MKGLFTGPGRRLIGQVVPEEWMAFESAFPIGPGWLAHWMTTDRQSPVLFVFVFLISCNEKIN